MCNCSPDMSVGDVKVRKSIAATALELTSTTTGKLLCDPFLFTADNAVISNDGGNGKLVQVTLTETCSTATPIKGDIRLLFFAPAGTAIAPGTLGATFINASPGKWLGTVDIVAADYKEVGTVAQAVLHPNLELFSGANDQDITVIALTNGTIDYAAAATLTLSLVVKQDF